MGRMEKLTAKQARFVEEYLVDLNATQAAIRAGYSEQTARVIGHENLTKPDIQKAITAAREKQQRRVEITADRVLEEYAKIAFFDPRKLFTADGAIKPVQYWDDDVAAVIGALDVVEIGDNGEMIGRVKKLKLIDKKGALDSIGKHLGMFVDRTELSGRDGEAIVISDAERSAKIAGLLAMAKARKDGE